MAPAFDGSAFRAVRLIDPVRTGRRSVGHCAVDWGVRPHVRNRSVGPCVPAARAQATDNGSNLTAFRRFAASFHLYERRGQQTDRKSQSTAKVGRYIRRLSHAVEVAKN